MIGSMNGEGIDLGWVPSATLKSWNIGRILLLFAAFVSLTVSGQSWPPLDAKVSQSVEALKRLKHMDIQSNAALNKVLLQTLEKVAGRPEFVELTVAFGLTHQDEALLDFVTKHPETSVGFMALDFLVTSRPPERLAQAIRENGATTLLSVLGELPHANASALLLTSATDKSLGLEERMAAMRALCRTKSGVEVLLAHEADQGIPQDLRLTAAYTFNLLPWPEVKLRALELIPLPTVKGEAPLPSIEALTLKDGNVERGRAVFLKPETGCAMCHQIVEEGVDFGPALSEIGDKLGKDALFQSILDPNGGISFGFEGWEIVMKTGEEWTGIVIGETEQSLTLKNQSGLLLTLEKESIESRSQMRSSLMPSGLQQAMTMQDLVDLVAYLSRCKKVP